MGIVTFVSSIPMLVVSPFAGVFIDRVNKHKALIILQTLFLAESFLLGILTISGNINIWHIIAIGMLIGVTGAIDMPLRQAFVVDLVDDSKDIGNAISLNSSSFNLARLIGPAVAGILIASFNEGICFLINSFSYVAVIAALLAMKIKSKTIKKETALNFMHEIKEGIKYSYKLLPIRIILIYLSITCLICMSYPVLMPIFAKEILHGDAQTLGILMSSSGAGALVGALYLASKKTASGLEKYIYVASMVFGIGMSALYFSKGILLSTIILFIMGFGMVVTIAACNTLLQYFVDDDKRGRVMSLYTMAFVGTTPIGGLLGGLVANKIGVPYTLLLCGLTMITAALFFGSHLKYFNIMPESVPSKVETPAVN